VVETATSSLLRVESIMGTTFALDVRDAPGIVDQEAVEAAFDWLHETDARFSTYRADSEISRLNRGELAEWQASADVRQVLAECEAMRRRTDGAFDARPHGPDGPLDPSGYVKGWALERATEMVARGGGRNFAWNGGGDVVVRGEAAPGVAWRVGVRHPLEHERVAAVLAVTDAAVASSGAYERGDHIVDPRTGRPPVGVLAVTVVGPSMTIADCFATAVFAMGADGASWLARSEPGYDGCAITADGRLQTTPGFEALRVRE
jgi:thiamine biosynthesis lipoprotein